MAGSENEDNGKIVYYYSREHRLARASPAVRELNDAKPVKAGFINRIAGTKGNLFMLVSIIVICVTFVYTSRSNSRFDSEEFLLGENSVSLRIESVSGDSLILHINKKTLQSGTGKAGNAADVYTGAVDLAVSPVSSGAAEDGETAPIMNHRIFFTYNDNETYSVALPFGGEKFLIVIQTESERIIRRISLKQ
jgi:hypothetical protein